MSTFAIKVDLAGLNGALDAKAQQVQAAARPAAQAGAQVLYQAVLANVAALGSVTGNLRAAIYQVYSQDHSGPGRATYHISWNARKAPHGHLVEWGYLQRYVYYKDRHGNIRAKVRPGMEGKPKPGRRASRAEKDAYWVTLPGGPRQVPAKSFIRNAESQGEQARQAMAERFRKELAA